MILDIKYNEIFIIFVINFLKQKSTKKGKRKKGNKISNGNFNFYQKSPWLTHHESSRSRETILQGIEKWHDEIRDTVNKRISIEIFILHQRSHSFLLLTFFETVSHWITLYIIQSLQKENKKREREVSEISLYQYHPFFHNVTQRCVQRTRGKPLDSVVEWKEAAVANPRQLTFLFALGSARFGSTRLDSALLGSDDGSLRRKEGTK